MPKICFVLAVLWLMIGRVEAQPSVETFHPYGEDEEEERVLRPDSLLFFRAIQSAEDLYGRITAFAMPTVGVPRRGVHFYEERARVDGAEIPYRYFTTLRQMGAEEYTRPGLGMMEGEIGGRGGVRIFDFDTGESLLPYYAGVNYADRGYRVRGRMAVSRTWRRGWHLSAAVDGRTGRDAHIRGVFTNALTGGFRLSRHFDEDNELALLVVLPWSQRGGRSASTGEAFSLTGDRYYNPAWGFQNGRIRNARVRREMIPVGVLSWRRPVSRSTDLETFAALEAGVGRQSGLGWYDARTPLPDNYRYMPSYVGDRATELAWRNADPRFTQIDWDELIARNRMKDGQAVYTLEDRVERLTGMQAGVTLQTRIDDHTLLAYGVRGRYTRSRRYREMRDLLGARYIVDIDQYLVDDDTYGNMLQNDLRHPDRRIFRGDRFGYDYALVGRSLSAVLRAEYHTDRLRGEAALEVGAESVFRRGFFEKELFPGENSLGRSRVMRFTPYTLKILGGYSFSPSSYLQAVFTAAAVTPSEDDLFVQPLYNNRTVEDPRPQRIFSGEVGWRFQRPVLDLQVTGFYTARFDDCATMRYFDDTSLTYADLVLSSVDYSEWGVELAAQVRLSRRWQIDVAVTGGRYLYADDARVEVLSDTDNRVLDRSKACLKNYHRGNIPQVAGCAGVGYWGRRGWGFRLSAGYVAGRYGEVSALRRTMRVVRQADVTEEAAREMTRQQRIDDAFTLDASLSKTFFFGHSRMTAFVSVRNLTGCCVPYAVYESSRLISHRVGDRHFRSPQPDHMTYSSPRSCFVSVSYHF